MPVNIDPAAEDVFSAITVSVILCDVSEVVGDGCELQVHGELPCGAEAVDVATPPRL